MLTQAHQELKGDKAVGVDRIYQSKLGRKSQGEYSQSGRGLKETQLQTSAGKKGLYP